MIKIKQQDSIRRNLIVFASVIFAMIAGVFCVLNYTSYLNQFFQDQMDRNVREVSQQIVITINDRISTHQNTVSSSADSIASATQIQSKGVMESLERDARRHGYIRYSVALPNGEALTTDGHPLNFQDVSFFKQAMSGKKIQTQIRASYVNNLENYMMIITPIIFEEEIKGVLCASLEVETIKAILDFDCFDGAASFRIIDTNGNTVMSVGDDSEQHKPSNFYEALNQNPNLPPQDILQLRQEIKQGKSGNFIGIVNQEKRYISYQPLQHNNWYLITSVPHEIVTGQTATFFKQTAMVTLIIAAAFLIIIFISLYSYTKSQDQLSDAVFKDHVTHGFNKNWFLMKARQLLEASDNDVYALVALDVSQFKLINDSFGAEKGDAALQWIYHCIQKEMTYGEIAVRSNADRFMLLLKNTSGQNIVARLERIAKNINNFNHGRKGKSYVITIVCGIYQIDDKKIDVLSMGDRAFVANANAKIKNHSLFRYAFFKEGDRVRLLKDKELENYQETALQNEEFTVYLQPKISLKTDHIAGCEALVRWNHPDKGLISPAEFIPIFERNGFVEYLDIYVFTQVCKTLQKWQNNGGKTIRISVNFSRIHITKKDFLQKFYQICLDYGVNPALIEFEITETMIVENIDMIADVMKTLHSYGFSCSIDDFGSGYSSLNVLKNVPADVIKLDKGFFCYTTLEEKNKGEKIIKNVIELSHQLGMTTVCEGVENITQLEFLRSVGCDSVQGFVFSVPITIEEFEKAFFENKLYS